MQVRLSKKVSDYLSSLGIDGSSGVNKWIEGIIDCGQTANSVDEELNLGQKIDLILSIVSKEKVSKEKVSKEKVSDGSGGCKEEDPNDSGSGYHRDYPISEKQRVVFDSRYKHFVSLFESGNCRGTEDRSVLSCTVFSSASPLDKFLQDKLLEFVKNKGLDYTLYL